MDPRTEAVALALAKVRYPLATDVPIVEFEDRRRAEEFIAMFDAVRHFDREIIHTEGR